MKPTDAEIIAKHYIIAAIWADAPEGTSPRACAQSVKYANRRAWEFLEIIGPDTLAKIRAAHDSGYGAHQDFGSDRPWLAAAGHDLWLTSQGHGTGFWDRTELPQDLRDKLTDCAHRFSGTYPEFYRGWLYLHGSGPISLTE